MKNLKFIIPYFITTNTATLPKNGTKTSKPANQQRKNTTTTDEKNVIKNGSKIEKNK